GLAPARRRGRASPASPGQSLGSGWRGSWRGRLRSRRQQVLVAGALRRGKLGVDVGVDRGVDGGILVPDLLVLFAVADGFGPAHAGAGEGAAYRAQGFAADLAHVVVALVDPAEEAQFDALEVVTVGRPRRCRILQHAFDPGDGREPQVAR